MYPIAVPADAIAAFCERNHVRKLSFFGSVLRDDFGPESDVDILVEFEEGKTPGLALVEMADELTRVLGRSVDLLTPKSLSRYFAADVLREAEPIYVAA